MAIHEHVVGRRSHRAFDGRRHLTADEVRDLLEAARWAPSAMNRQPWRFIVGIRGDDTHRALFSALNERNQVWAGSAGALIAVLVDNGSQSEDASGTDPGRAYDVGLAMGQVGLQAAAMGLTTHQMGGFDKARVSHDFDLPGHVQPIVVVAVGRPGEAANLPEPLRRRETAVRERLPLQDIVYTGQWGEPWAADGAA